MIFRDMGDIDMPTKYFFSINLLIKSDSHIEKSISSVISDESFFKEHVQLLLINSVGSDFTYDICRKYCAMYPENVQFIDAEGKSTAECYNETRSISSGQYIAFIDNYGEYSKNALSSLYNIIKKGKIPVVCIQPLISPPGEDVRPYTDDIDEGLIKLRDNPDRFILMLGCYFFHRKVLNDVYFDDKLKLQNDVKFITDILLKTYSYVFIRKILYTSNTATEKEFVRYELQYSKRFYIKYVNEFIIPMLKSYIGSSIVQAVMMYLINVKFSLNADDKYNNVIAGRYVTEFIDCITEALTYIDDSIILSRRLCNICNLDEEMPFRFLAMKYHNEKLHPDMTIVPKNETAEKVYTKMNGHLYSVQLSNEIAFSINKSLIQRSEHIRAEISAINFDRDGLYIDAYLEGCACIDEKYFTLNAIINRKKYNVIRSEVYTTKKFFDIPFLKKYSFRMFIPVSMGKEMDTIYLMMKIANFSFKINIGFKSTYARLSDGVEHSYWCFNDRLLTYDRKSKTIIIRRATDSLIGLYENKFINEISKKLTIAESFHYRRIRSAVRRFISDSQRHKTIMFYDNEEINLNGNLLFRYFSKFKNNELIDVYFSAQRESLEQAFLIDSGYAGVLEKGSNKAKIIAMASDIIIAVNNDVYRSLQFDKRDIDLLKDLFHANIISIKNSFATIDTPEFNNRLNDNIQKVFCASVKEKEKLLQTPYDYDESMIEVLGYPMLDAIKNKQEKIIMFAPGERKLFCIFENSNYYHFSNSRFFKVYNSIFSDPEFMASLKVLGYKIAVIMPHSIEKYIKMFHIDSDVVTLYHHTEQNETELIEKSSVLITDYSHTEYKFAYLNKPVIYYHPQSLPIQKEYKEQHLSKNVFGDIVYDDKQLKETVIKLAKRDFPQPLRFERRCKDFFRYTDGNNCERIMDNIIDGIFPNR